VFFGVVGDIHGDFAALDRVQRRHTDVAFWLCVGDVADHEGRYPAPAAPLYWIKGNNENFDVIADYAARSPSGNLVYLPNAVPLTVDAVRIVGLGGTFAPSWYEQAADALPPSKRPDRRDDKRRHFVHEEVSRCAALQGIDVFLSHEAPRPYFVNPSSASRRRVDAGKTPINEILSAMAPRLHFFGHHHAFTDQMRQGVRSIGLDLVGRSYVLVDRESFACNRLDA
jgi:predicted phosphodiesterase